MCSSAARDIYAALEACEQGASKAAQLVRDGATARQRSLERLCGLGRELDGSSFDESLWRRTLADLTLEEIHTHLRAFEIRFDEKYPPEQIAQPERLSETENAERTDSALAILRD